MRNKKLYRSRHNKMLFGLCGGLGDYFKIDPTLIRIAFVILEFATVGLLIFGYLIVALIVPKEPTYIPEDINFN
jgi:phage shock protein C